MPRGPSLKARQFTESVIREMARRARVHGTVKADGSRARRDFMLEALGRVGFAGCKPRGAHYVMADISRFGFEDDVAFARWLVRDVGIAVVPGSSFYGEPASGAQQVRFCFPKRRETLDDAAQRLATVPERAALARRR
jgi:aminotransferase